MRSLNLSAVIAELRFVSSNLPHASLSLLVTRSKHESSEQKYNFKQQNHWELQNRS